MGGTSPVWSGGVPLESFARGKKFMTKCDDELDEETGLSKNYYKGYLEGRKQEEEDCERQIIELQVEVERLTKLAEKLDAEWLKATTGEALAKREVDRAWVDSGEWQAKYVTLRDSQDSGMGHGVI
tara:strand:- start:128 stop:505 length:378 start_codon:yes stop_codon:yes gene_type:complete